MILKRQYIASIILGCIICSVSAQSFEHRKFKYNWHDELKLSLSQSEKYKAYPAVILYEETSIDIDLQHIKRYQRIQFNDQAAIDDYNLFRVPIITDTRLAQIQNIYRTDTSNFPKLLFERINFFDARIIRNGEIVKAVLDENAYRLEERAFDQLLPYYVHYFYVRNLQPGDQLDIVISHHLPMYPFKYYLNEGIPKQELYLTIQNSALGQVDTYINPQLGEFISNEQSTDQITHKILFENLEPVAPFISTNIYDLPRIEIFNNKKYTITEELFAKQTIETMLWKDLLYPFVNRIDPAEMRTWDQYDLQSYKTSQFFEKMKLLGNNNLQGAALMNLIHQYAVDKLEYKNDFNYFIHQELGFNDMGTYLEKGILREASRHEFYYHMLDRVNKPYYKILLQDQRIQIIDTLNPGICYADHLAYILFDEDSNSYLFYPKTGRFGYYTNELPFYLMGQYVHLIPQMVPRKIYDREPDHIAYPLKSIESSQYAVNNKKVVTSIQVSLEKLESSIQQQVSLSGQFSTLTRGYYQYGWKDTTISPTYYSDIFNKIPLSQVHLDSAQKTYPYFHQFGMIGDQYKNVYSTLDSSYVVDLSQLINSHYENINAKYFKANYHCDFPGKEEFWVEINFDQLVKIEDLNSHQHKIICPQFAFNSQITKVADNHYQLQLSWDIKEANISSKEVPILSEVFKEIRRLSLLKIKLTLL